MSLPLLPSSCFKCILDKDRAFWLQHQLLLPATPPTVRDGSTPYLIPYVLSQQCNKKTCIIKKIYRPSILLSSLAVHSVTLSQFFAIVFFLTDTHHTLNTYTHFITEVNAWPATPISRTENTRLALGDAFLPFCHCVRSAPSSTCFIGYTTVNENTFSIHGGLAESNSNDIH